jgi:hypothetical protein
MSYVEQVSYCQLRKKCCGNVIGFERLFKGISFCFVAFSSVCQDNSTLMFTVYCGVTVKLYRHKITSEAHISSSSLNKFRIRDYWWVGSVVA